MKNNKQKSKGKSRVPANRNCVIQVPGPLITTLEGNHTFRFRMSATSQTRINISRLQLLCLYMCNASTTVGYPIFGAVKVNWIKMFGPPQIAATASNTNEMDLIWAGVTGSQLQLNSFSPSTSATPYMRSYPPKDSAAEHWCNFPFCTANSTGAAFGEGAELMFSLLANPNTLLDINLSYTLNDTPSFFTYTTTGLTQGACAYNALDNLGISGALRNWDPLGVRDFTTFYKNFPQFKVKKKSSLKIVEEES